MQALSTISAILFVILISSCNHKNSDTSKVKIQGDTLKIVTETKGDTIIKRFIRLDNKIDDNHDDTSVYYFKNTDTTIELSDFYFAFKRFKIYFDSKKVIQFCDSILKSYPAPKNKEEYYSTWNQINTIERLKKFEESGKPKTEQLAGWSETLLERFSPLIIDTITQQKATKLVVEKFTNATEGHRSYFAITYRDTSLVGYEQDFWNLAEIK